MSWREILNPECCDISDKSPNTGASGNENTEKKPFSHFSRQNLRIKKKKTEPPLLDRLTDQGLEVYQEYVQEMLFPKHGSKLTLAAAQSLAMELVSCLPENIRK